MIDIIAAVCDYLLAQSDITDLVEDRVFAGEIPEDEIDNMPQKMILIQYDGGLTVNSCLPISSPRMSFFCYGQSYFEAGRVDREVYSTLKSLQTTRVGEALIHSASIDSGPRMMRDSKTGWYFQWRSATIIADDREIS